MSILSKVKNKLKYMEIEPYYITEKTVSAYETASVCGGSIANKNAVITGGGSGIGFATAHRFVIEGCKVVIVGRNAEKLQKAKDELGENCSIYAWDVSNYENCNEKIKDIEKLLDGKIDIWVNSHGIICEYDTKARFRVVPEECLRNVLKINLSSVYAIDTAVAEYLAQNKRQGCILNISSITADYGSTQYTPYGWSKCGVNAVTETLQSKYREQGVRILSIAPGTCATGMMQEWLGQKSSEDLNIARPINYLNRAILPQEVAALAAIMVSKYGENTRWGGTISAGESYS